MQLKPTKRMIDALIILKDTNYHKTIGAAQFGREFWPDHIMHVQMTNTGNGACAGKKGWLAAGSYLRKLKIKGLVALPMYVGAFYITDLGKKVLIEYLESKNVKA